MLKRVLALLCLLSALPPITHAAETDQYLTWEFELNDSAGVFNNYLNTQIQEFLNRRNRRTRPIKDEKLLAQDLFVYFFQGLQASKVRSWVNRSKAIEKYPPKTVSFWKYQRMSVFRDLSFPYVLPMTRTLRIGDVYLGVDKIGHFFGFGRRYYKFYTRLRGEGVGEEEAMRRTVYWGISQEALTVGGVVDGIFSHGDLEANYQGFLFCKDLCEGESPYFTKLDGKWVLTRPVDIRDYITPGFDESWNNNHYTGSRRREVLRRVRETYCDKRNGPIVTARFARYAQYPRSLNQQLIAQYFQSRGKDPQHQQSLEVICNEQ